MTCEELRLHAHRSGLEKLKSGQFDLALQELEACLATFGSHLGVLADVAGVAYLKNDMEYFRSAVTRLETELEANFDLVSASTRVRTLITLAKYYEELGRISESYEALENATRALDVSDGLGLFLDCQKLRWLASFGRETEAAELFQRCLGASEAAPQLLIECFHAVMIAEARLFGVELAAVRFERLLERSDLQAADASLCAVDLVEVAVETCDKAGLDRVLELLSRFQISAQNPYEQWILRVALQQENELTLADLFSCTRDLTPMGLFRLTALALKCTAQNQTRSNLLKKHLLFQLQACDHRSRRILTKRWDGLLASQGRMRVAVDGAAVSIEYSGSRLSFKQSVQSWSLLCEAIRGDVRSNASLNETESVRIAVLRLNRKLASFLGTDWVVRSRKGVVELNPLIEWIS